MVATLLHTLVENAANRAPCSIALKHNERTMTYAELAQLQTRLAGALHAHGVARDARVGVLLAKSFEFVVTVFGASKAGAIFVPINPVLMAAQIGHILRDSETSVLVLSAERYSLIVNELSRCPALEKVVIVGDLPTIDNDVAWSVVGWNDFIDCAPFVATARSDDDAVAILYTSGSTGRPKGVVLSHRNLVSGAISVVAYLNNRSDDRLIAVLPFSFDAGFSQLTTAFLAGACVVMLNYLMPHQVIRKLQQESITGLTAVPPLYAQLAALDWPESIDEHLRYFASTGGRMPKTLLNRLRKQVPSAQPYLMYGLTEAFRSTYLPPAQVDVRPDSIGIAIPNQEVLVLDPNGRPCAADEPGELVHRGSTVALGYWNDPVRTAKRFRPLPDSLCAGAVAEIAVFSGDIVYRDTEGYLYFVGRRDDMIKSNGYRISPTEIEEVAYDSGWLAEAAAVGIEHPALGQAIVLVGVPVTGVTFSSTELIALFRSRLPAHMVPSRIEIEQHPLRRNPNGKIDRKAIAESLSKTFQ